MDDLTHQADEDARVLGGKLGLSRRQMLAATTGMAAAAVLGIGGAQAAHAAPNGNNGNGNGNNGNGNGPNGILIPAPRRGIILYTVRDAISRDPNTTDLPSGFKEVFAALSAIGYQQVEFAGFSQSANAEGGNVNNIEGAKLLRTWLDDNGLRAQGNHGTIPSTITDASLAAFDTACEVANILGFKHIGTGSDPTSSSYLADWQAAAERWNLLGARASQHGLKLYTHNHSPAYSFLLDSGPNDAQGRPTRSSGIRRLEWFLANTDPKNVYLEMDIYWAHVAQHQHRSYMAPDGSTVTSIFDPAGLVASQTDRYPLFHAKDGKITDNADGYSMVPFGTGDIDYSTFYRRIGAKGNHHSMYEQDNAASYPTSSPAASLGNSDISYQGLAALRG